MRECRLTILYHVIENTVAKTIDVTYVQHIMGRLDVIPQIYNVQIFVILIGSTFYSMVYMFVSKTFVWPWGP